MGNDMLVQGTHNIIIMLKAVQCHCWMLIGSEVNSEYVTRVNDHVLFLLPTKTRIYDRMINGKTGNYTLELYTLV